MADLSIRLRRATPGLLSLPWLEPLVTWSPEVAEFRELPVGPSRHTVRFLQADGVLYALKELPTRVARKEYRVLRDLEARMLPAVQVVGLVEQPAGGNSILVTEFLTRSWQYRRLFQRLPRLARHRDRLLDAMAMLLVAALAALAARQAPPDSAAAMEVVEASTGSFRPLDGDGSGG